ncbi:hypothetical protein NFI96_001345, partial [Prochilodus magdalenae]
GMRLNCAIKLRPVYCPMTGPDQTRRVHSPVWIVYVSSHAPALEGNAARIDYGIFSIYSVHRRPVCAGLNGMRIEWVSESPFIRPSEREKERGWGAEEKEGEKKKNMKKKMKKEDKKKFKKSAKKLGQVWSETQGQA